MAALMACRMAAPMVEWKVVLMVEMWAAEKVETMVASTATKKVG